MTLDHIRKSAVLCTLLATLPLLPQLPPMLLMLLGILLVAAFFLPKPHALLRLTMLGIAFLLLLLAYKGRFGRDTASAMLALMMAMKCLETSTLRDLRALLGFALFLPFSALLIAQAPWTLALSLLSVLSWFFLLQISSTGQVRWPDQPWWLTLKGVLRSLTMAIPMTLALFWLFPRISTPLWGLPGLSGQGTGLGDSMKPGQWLDILNDDRIAFRVDFQGHVPPPEQRYWRGPVLWDFDGIEWRRNPQDNKPASMTRKPPTGAATHDPINYRVSLEPTEKKYLPALDWPREAPTPYTLSADSSLYSGTPIQKMTQYTARAWTQPDRAQRIGNRERQRALAYPRAFNKRTQALATQWRAEAGSDRAYIARVLQWIHRDFSYTLDTSPPRLNAVDHFLFEERQGFCQHFSSAFTLLMRAAGIPARIVTGYVGGYRNPYGGYWVLYIKDAHAWTEVWLQGEGWQRIDPTAAVAPEKILDTVNSTDNLQQDAGSGNFSPLFDYADFMRSRWNDWVIGFNAAQQSILFRNIGFAQAARWQMLLVLLSLAALIALAIFVVLKRVKIAQHPLEIAWHKLLQRLQRQGHLKATHETAMHFAKRCGHAELIAIATHYTQWRYGKTSLNAAECRALQTRINTLNVRQIVTSGFRQSRQ